jgi:hypothetical protein
MRKNRNKWLVFDMLCILFVTIFMIGMTWFMGREIARQLTWTEAEGKVLDVRAELKTDDDGDDYRVYYAAVSYYADGERRVSVLYNGVHEVSAGDLVRFLRNPQNPTETVMKNNLWWFGFAVCGFVSVMFIIVSLSQICCKGRSVLAPYRANR